MEDRNKYDYEHVTNQEPSLVQHFFAPIEHVNNMLPIGTELIQPVQSKLVQLI
jgi:hypothetical protein